ncbi:hypothetical protein [Enterococcus phage vB_Efs25_KEN11]|uniref:Uncharacterized protein n=1 Tax=Enterococcus phage vB_Efs6_KEN16 TaxID=3138325 RepID=A0AAX4PRT0_9CAUD
MIMAYSINPLNGNGVSGLLLTTVVRYSLNFYGNIEKFTRELRRCCELA